MGRCGAGPGVASQPPLYRLAAERSPETDLSRRLGIYNLKAELGGLFLQQRDLLAAVSVLVILHRDRKVSFDPLSDREESSNGGQLTTGWADFFGSPGGTSPEPGETGWRKMKGFERF